MRRVAFIVLSLLMTGAFSLSAQSRGQQKKSIKQLEQEGRPREVIAAAQEEFRKAQSERRTTRMMQAFLVAMGHRKHLSTDSLYVDLAALEEWVADPITPVSDAAMLHSLLGSIYAYSAQGGYSNKVVNPLPEDMSQWTRLMYHQRAFDHFAASVSRLEELQGYSTLNYTPITYTGRWSDMYQHDLMHLIGRRAVFGINGLERQLSRAYEQTPWREFTLDYDRFRLDTLTSASAYDCPAFVMRTFQRMLRLLEKNRMSDGWLSMEQNRLFIIPWHARDEEECLRLLQGLKEKYSASDLCASICYDIATILRRQQKNTEALTILHEGIKKYPQYGVINLLSNMVKEIQQPSLFMRNTSQHHYPSDTATLHIRHRNLTSCTVWLRRVQCPLDTLQAYSGNAEGLKRYSTFYGEQKFALQRDTNYLTQDTVVHLPLPKEAGIYLIEAIANGKGSNLNWFYVTPYKLVSRSLPGGLIEYVVVDARSGHPIKDATLHMARYDHKQKRIVPTEAKRMDKDGCITILSGFEGDLVRVSTEADNSMPYVSKNHYSAWPRPHEQKRLITRLMSDRTHFRPGQTIYIKGISHWQMPNDSVWTAKEEEIELTLKNPKGQVVETKRVRSNEFGSFDTEFVLPTGGLNGTYRVEQKTGNPLHLQVEEYKLPTFEVTFDKVTAAYAIGDTVVLTGHAVTYSGVPVADGRVSYRVHKTYNGWLDGWRDFWNNEEMTDGQTTTDSDGRFRISVPLNEVTEMKEKLSWWRHRYEITGTVTSPTGESHDARTSLTLSSIPLEISLQQIGEHWLKGKPHPVTFKVTNLSGEPVETKVNFRIYRTDKTWDREKKTLVHEGTTASNRELTFEFLDKFPSAYYQIEATTRLDGKKDSVMCYDNFILYSEEETKVPLGTTDWFHCFSEEVSTDQPLRLQFGTRERDAYILMDIFSAYKRIDSRRIYMSDTVQTFTFDYLPKYGDAMHVSVMYVKDGEIQSYSRNIRKKLPQKKLELKWATFRDRLTLGTQEEWTLTVNHPDGTPADAELLASMYDTSLDQLGRQRPWGFGFSFLRGVYAPLWWNDLGHRYVSTRITFDLLTKNVPGQWKYDDVAERYYNFNLALFLKYAEKEQAMASGDNGVFAFTGVDHSLQGRIAGLDVATRSKAIGQTNGIETASLEEETITAAMENFQAATTTPESLPEGMKLREDFTETAFFQPHLRTDSAGRVKVSFTLPDNLTRWHFRALAHTKQMDYGTLEDYATAQREFMVQPNLPRFVRVGDETTVSATLSNLSEKRIKGTARMELIDPVTEQVILTRKAKFDTQAGKTTTVTFAFTVKNTDTPLPVCRIVADGGKFSDGEQRYLPVLTDKVWITESQPLMVNGPGKVTEQLDHLFNHHSPTATNHRLTVELTGNPAWLAIQALPTVATPTEEDAFSWAAAWYAHSVASHIAQSQPKIKAVFDSWLADGSNEKALWSNLQKNEELKTILLEETPWVAEATNEAAQKRQLALLFDKANTRQRIEGYLQKLASLQKEEGGWSWYKGMKSSRYVTTYILELMERAVYLTGDEQGVESHRMMERAANFLNQELTEEYERLLKREKEGQEVCPSDLALTYLCSQALNGKKPDKEIEKMAEYMVRLLPKQLHTLTPYGKAKASILLKQYGLTEEADRFLTSLKEYTSYTPQMGRFFDNPSAIFGWRNQRIPTQVATIEALTFAGGDSLTVEEMKQWLLVQKQTQHWGNPLSTVDAVHALLMRGADLLSTEQSTTLKLDEKAVTSAVLPTPGLDYLKRSYTTDELKRLPREASIEKNRPGLAWGAVYAQYLEEMDRTTSTYTGRTATEHGQALDQPLSIERTWMVERPSPSLPLPEGEGTDNTSSQSRPLSEKSERATWIPLTEGMVLHVGDRVMSQLTIRADRAMDFVQVKDSRAACTEPVSVASGYHYEGGVGLYRSVKDAATLYFIDHLPKGTYTLEQTFRIDRTGHYQAGLATVQCAYAPEFVGHTSGSTLQVK
ncbi:MAG: hypothetical protein IJ013_01700 [Bacteroidaceae bacterium]|nr:hypothetical protein [Bacteroidaceae bacterium]